MEWSLRFEVSLQLVELQELEREVERQWWWLHGALNAVAQARAAGSHGDARTFRHAGAGSRGGSPTRADRAPNC
jgi:hypothetical protein